MATRRVMGKGIVWALAFAACCVGAVAWASEVTDVMDSAETNKPFGASLRLRFESDSRSSVLAREVKCLSNDVAGKGLCPNSGIYLNKEATYSRTRNVMNIDARIGLYHDLEVYAYIPVVTSDSHEMAFASGVGPSNSTIFPAYAKDVLFQLPYKSVERAGLGDITLGLRWAPYNFYRDNTGPTVDRKSTRLNSSHT